MFSFLEKLRHPNYKHLNTLAYGVSEPNDYNTWAKPRTLTPGQRRAIATGAILFYNGDDPMKQLLPMKAKSIPAHRDMLRNWWEIETPADAVARLDSLHQVGHRSYRQPELVQNEPEWRQLFDRSDFLRGRVVQSVAGWDFARITNLAYWTYQIGLIDFDTACHYFDVSTRLTLGRFNSWDELATSFLAGRMMWNPDIMESHQIMGGIAKYLLQSPHNVWQECPWEDYAGL